ncbi:MAG: citramalate synthase [Thermodesulfobacteriota bacterium]
MRKKDNKKIILYDTTLRDGTQAEEVAFSVEDKVRVALRLDELGLDYIEGGWPGSNPRDIEFFKAMKGQSLSHSTLVSFGATRRARVKAKDDPSVKNLVRSGTPVVTIFGKSWKMHVQKALRVTLAENLDMIGETIEYLKKRVDKVFYDAEHFFDGYKADARYAMKTIETALDAGADYIVLCDTNGGTLPFEVAKIVAHVRENINAPIGIHAHNDADTAVAASLAAVREGAGMVQGTINGFGERCGNADLCSIIPALQLKMGLNCLEKGRLGKLRETSRFVYEIANISQRKHQPYVGQSAFAHKAGIHVSAVLRNPLTYEHIEPESVGNNQRVLVSDLSGRSSIVSKAAQFGLDVKSDSPVIKDVLERLKTLENEGFQYEGAEASFELLVQKALKKKKRYFKLHGFRVIDEKRTADLIPHAEATIKIEVDGEVEHTAAEGTGPVNALDVALRKALERFYPGLKDVGLIDFKVRVLAGQHGTAAKVRVLVLSGDGLDKWGTVGVSENVIEACWRALVDSLEYKLYKDEKKNVKRRRGQGGVKVS